MVIIYCVRHGKTLYNIQNKIIGHHNISLLADNKEYFSTILSKIKNISFNAFFSSDLLRALESSKKISSAIGEKPVFDSRLREVDYGILTHMDKNEAKRKYPEYHKSVDFVNPGGESFKDMEDRVASFVKELSGEKVLVVSHAGVIRVIISLCKNQSLKNLMNTKIPHGSVVVCDFNNKEVSFL